MLPGIALYLSNKLGVGTVILQPLAGVAIALLTLDIAMNSQILTQSEEIVHLSGISWQIYESLLNKISSR